MTHLHVDFYKVLSVPRTASTAEIKSAYHRALLQHHPDKGRTTTNERWDITTIKDAYNILSSPTLRAQHDLMLSLTRQEVNTGPRPAQVISLEEFEEQEHDSTWRYPCRCGGNYRITEDDMDKGIHLIGCDSCSEAVWVGFELAEEQE